MPALRIIYVSDHVGRAETVTAHFESPEDALAAFSAAGLRVLQIGELRAGERAADPIRVAMAGAATAPPREALIRGMALGAAAE
jgi:hypothetical protein